MESPEEDELRHSHQLGPEGQTLPWGSCHHCLSSVSLCGACLYLQPTPATTPGEGEASRTQEGATYLPVFSPVNSLTPFFACRERRLKGGVFTGVPDSERQSVSPGWGLGLSPVPDTPSKEN